jgi:hypothetical protein
MIALLLAFIFLMLPLPALAAMDCRGATLLPPS